MIYLLLLLTLPLYSAEKPSSPIKIKKRNIRLTHYLPIPQQVIPSSPTPHNSPDNGVKYLNWDYVVAGKVETVAVKVALVEDKK